MHVLGTNDSWNVIICSLQMLTLLRSSTYTVLIPTDTNSIPSLNATSKGKYSRLYAEVVSSEHPATSSVRSATLDSSSLCSTSLPPPQLSLTTTTGTRVECLWQLCLVWLRHLLD